MPPLLQGWCGIGPRFCGPGKCLSGPCEGDPLDAPPGCDGLCNATSLDGKPSRAQCRSGLLISDIQAPKQLGGACNSTQAARCGMLTGQGACVEGLRQALQGNEALRWVGAASVGIRAERTGGWAALLPRLG